jgi:hypothetical protein
MSMIPPTGFGQIEKVFGKFKYVELSKGAVDIDDTWEHDNIVTLRNVCGTKCSIQLHRLVAPIFETCLKEAMVRCPQYKIRMLGGFVPRHMRHDPKLPLSTHSWGIAFDINWDTNPMGSKLVTDLPLVFLSAFEDQGWEWGGRWRSVKDAMHFQYCRGV